MDFSLNCAWLLDAYTWDANLPSGYCKKRSHGTKLRNLILSGELVPKDLSPSSGGADDWKTSFQGRERDSFGNFIP